MHDPALLVKGLAEEEAVLEVTIPTPLETPEQIADEMIRRQALAFETEISRMIRLAAENPERFAALVVALGKLRDRLGADGLQRVLRDAILAANLMKLDVHAFARLLCDQARQLESQSVKG